MRFLLVCFVGLFLNSCSKLESMIPDALKGKLRTSLGGDKRELYVVHIHGDWCGTCKSIDSHIHKVESYFRTKNEVNYIVFDQTNPQTIARSLRTAKIHGLENLFEHERHTGEVIFVDKKTKNVLTKVYGVASAQEYRDITYKLLHGEEVPNLLARRKDYKINLPDLTDAKEADLLVVDIHHDMCSGCAITRPVFEKVARKYRHKDEVYFLTFDLTTPQSVDTTRGVARELGLEPIYDSHKHTGEVIFIDAKTKRVMGSVVKETNKDKYHKLIKQYRKQLKA